jgi:predicted nucleic acid-binding protein
MPEKAIIDTSVLIALERINLLDILCKIYSHLILPEAVVSEFGPLSIECYSSEKVKSPMVGLLVLDLNLGLKITGTIGILLKAESLALIDSAYDKAKELRDKGFYISDQLLDSLSRYSK